jgi:hypothetical protein
VELLLWNGISVTVTGTSKKLARLWPRGLLRPTWRSEPGAAIAEWHANSAHGGSQESKALVQVSLLALPMCELGTRPVCCRVWAALIHGPAHFFWSLHLAVYFLKIIVLCCIINVVFFENSTVGAHDTRAKTTSILWLFAHRMHTHFQPEQWLLCHMGLY